MQQPHKEADLLYGVPAIADYLNLSRRQVYHLASVSGLPTFKIGGKTICARKSTLDGWLRDQEAKAHAEGCVPDASE